MLQSTSGRRVQAVIPSTAYEMPSCPATGQRHPNFHIGFGQFDMDELGGKTHEHILKHTDIGPMFSSNNHASTLMQDEYRRFNVSFFKSRERKGSDPQVCGCPMHPKPWQSIRFSTFWMILLVYIHR